MTVLNSELTVCLKRFSRGKQKYLVISPNKNNQKNISLGQHKHTFFEFCTLSQGRVSILHNSESINLNSGMTLVVTPGTCHCEMPISAKHHYRLLWGVLDPVILHLHISEYQGKKEFRTVDYINLPNTIRFLISELETIIKKEGDDYENQCYFQSIIMTAITYAMHSINYQKGENKWTEKIILEIEKFVEDNLSNRIHLKNISSSVGLSPAYSSALYKKFRGDTLFHYINEKRIQSACSLLADSKLNISEISDRVGFDDPYYFSKVFKRFCGCAPREYRNSLCNPTDSKYIPVFRY